MEIAFRLAGGQAAKQFLCIYHGKIIEIFQFIKNCFALFVHTFYGSLSPHPLTHSWSNRLTDAKQFCKSKTDQQQQKF